MKKNIAILMVLITMKLSFSSMQAFASGNESASSEVSTEDSSQNRNNLRKKMKAKKRDSVKNCEKKEDGKCIDEKDSSQGD